MTQNDSHVANVETRELIKNTTQSVEIGLENEALRQMTLGLGFHYPLPIPISLWLSGD